MGNQLDMSVAGDNRGLIAGRDIENANLINTGDVVGNYNAIGVGAQVIINQIQQARSAIAEMAAELQLAETQLANAVERKLEQLTRAVEQSGTANRRNPYKSLLDYQLEDTAYFYGRDQAIHTLLGKIHDQRLTILHADSGAGKSSLLQAGIAARVLAAGHLPLHLRPFRQAPTPSIKRAFLPDVDRFPELARFQQMSLVGFLQAVTTYLGKSTLYLFLDQFEEFFLELPAPQQEPFVHELAACLEQTGLNVRWVLSLRKEQFSDLNLFQPRIAPFANEFFLPRFTRSEAKAVITAPARHFGVIYESDVLVDTILTDLREQDDTLQPPQVQLVCYHLFEEALLSATPNLISTTLYSQPRGRGFHGAQGILSNHLARTVARFPALDGKLARRILEALISSNTRRVRVTRGELRAALCSPSVTATDHLNNVLAQLVNERLLRLDETADEEPLYELAHDYLLAEIELDEETLRHKFAQELLNQQVAAWQANNSIRIAQETLAIIEQQENVLQVDRDSTTLLRLSREAIGRRRRIVRYSYGAAGVAIAIAVIAGIIAIGFSIAARDAHIEMTSANTIAAAVQLATDVQVLLRREVPPHGQILDKAINAIELLMRNNLEIPSPVEQSLRDAIAASRLLATFPNPTNAAYRALSLSPDGTVLVTGNSDNTVHLYPLDNDSMQTPYVLRGHTNGISDLSSVRNGLVASIGREAIVWDIQRRKEIFHTRTEPFTEFAIEIDPAGMLLAIGGAGTIRLYHVDQLEQGPQQWLRTNASAMIRDIQFDASGEYLISGGDDGIVRLWKLADAAIVWQSEELSSPITSVAMNPENTLLAAMVYDQLFIWQRLRTQVQNQMHFDSRGISIGGHEGYSSQVRFSPNGRCIVTAGEDTFIRVWDATNLTLKYILDGHTDAVYAISFAPQLVSPQQQRFSTCGQHLYSVGWDKTIRMWNISAPAEVATLTGFAQPVEAVDIWDDSILATADQAGMIITWDLDRFTLSQQWKQSDERLGDVRFTPDGQFLVTAGWDSRIVFWQWQAVSPSEHFTDVHGHHDAVQSISFNADGSRMISASRDLSVKIWDTRTNRLLHSQSTVHYALDAALSPQNDNLLAVATFLDARLYDMAHGNSWILDKSSVYDVEFLSHQEVLVTTGAGGIHLWDLGQGNDISLSITLTIDSAPTVLCIAVAEEENMLIAGTSDGKLIAWKLDEILNSSNLEGKLISQLGVGINDIEINADEGLVVAAGGDGTVRVLALQLERLLQIAKDRRQHYKQQ